jgi:hypothetical protein
MEGANVAQMVIIVGSWIYAATVTTKGALDEAAVERFFSSVRVEIPWRIEVFPEEGITMALPAPAPALPPVQKGESMTHVYQLGGAAELTFSVTTFPLSEERLRTASVDQILDDGIRGISGKEGNHVDKLNTIEHGGVPGREVTHHTDKGVHLRSRMLVLGRRGHVVTIASTDPARVGDAAAMRFLESLRLSTP